MICLPGKITNIFGNGIQNIKNIVIMQLICSSVKIFKMCIKLNSLISHTSKTLTESVANLFLLYSSMQIKLFTCGKYDCINVVNDYKK